PHCGPWEVHDRWSSLRPALRWGRGGKGVTETQVREPRTEPASTQRQRYLGLDVLRASAIVLVLIAHFVDRATFVHLHYTPLPLLLSGHFGVELFFVLSGFLIGNLLLDILARRPTVPAWAIFMCRRVMRTLPAYFAWLLILVATKSLGQTAPYVLEYFTLTQN